ncbi:hypothetical protein [Lacipirellula sp.]|uniref:hypothetical protein n=1 Tax=Lacipirellula sp. TaxID=2691419 RepID=UPI003D0DD42B
MLYRRLAPLVWLLIMAPGSVAQAGMPAPLPLEVPRVLQLSTPALERFQAISFFLFVFAACAAVVMLLWNYVQRDFPRLPRLSFGRAAAGVFLWGLLFVIVLTMISGARELMTPRAWEQRGYTYQLAEPPATSGEAPANDQSRVEAPDLTATSSEEGGDR